MTYLYTHGTDIVTRVHIDPETGTAMDGQLWSEESLPSESILAGLVEEMPSERTRPARAGDLLEALRQLLDDPLQLGGKATVGKGRCRVHLVSDEPRRSS
jgi:CRISPR-associated protein Cmr4